MLEPHLLQRVVMQWHRLLRVVMGSPSLEVFRTCGDVALGDVVRGHGGLGMRLAILEGLSKLIDSVREGDTAELAMGCRQ